MTPEQAQAIVDAWFVDNFYANGPLFSEPAFAHCQAARADLVQRLTAQLGKEG